MSRLQKKKPAGEKKKKNVTQVGEAEGSGAVKLTGPKSSGGPLKAKAEKKAAEVKTGEANVFQNAMEFLREVKVELKKVTWPTRKQTTGTTIVVIVFVFVVAGFLGLFDFGLSKLVQVVLT